MMPSMKYVLVAHCNGKSHTAYTHTLTHTPQPTHTPESRHVAVLSYMYVLARVQGGGRSPPLEIENKKRVIRANFKLFHLYFATFLVGNIIFSAMFWAGPPWKAKTKIFQIFGPPPYEFLDTPLMFETSIFYYTVGEQKRFLSSRKILSIVIMWYWLQCCSVVTLWTQAWPVIVLQHLQHYYFVTYQCQSYGTLFLMIFYCDL